MKEREKMASVNKAIIVGNLGTDPEMKVFENGSCCKFRVATNRKYKTAAGEYKEETQWHSIVVWGKQAENCNEFLVKGRPVYVEGRLSTRQWEDRDGNKRETTEIVAHSVQFLGSKGKPASDDEGNIPF